MIPRLINEPPSTIFAATIASLRLGANYQWDFVFAGLVNIGYI